MAEFHFEQDVSNGGKLSYRCLEFVITSESDDMPEGESELWQRICKTLNEHFDHEDEPDDE